MTENSQCSTSQERGEVDTSLPFRSVKAALSIFGEKTKVKKSEALERPVLKDAKVYKLKEQAAASGSQLSEAERAKTKTCEELKDTRNEIIIEACGETCGLNQLQFCTNSWIPKSQEDLVYRDNSMPDASLLQSSRGKLLLPHDAEQKEEPILVSGRNRKNLLLDGSDSSKKDRASPKQSNNTKAEEKHVVWQVELKVAQEQHMNAVAELKLVKKDLERVKQELVESLTEKENALRQAEEALIAAELNAKRVEDLSHEMSGTNESLVLVKLACIEASKDRAALLAVNGATSLHDTDTTEHSMVIVEELEMKLALATKELIRLQEELGLAKEAELRVASAASEAYANLSLAKAELKKTRFTTGASSADVSKTRRELDIAWENGELLQANLVNLQIELESMRKELADLRNREEIASAAVATLTAELARTKEDLSSAMAAKMKANEAMAALKQTLHQTKVEADEAKATADALREEAMKARTDAEHAKLALTRAEQELKAAMEATEAAKASEHDAIECVKILSIKKSENYSKVGGSFAYISPEEYDQLELQMHEEEVLASIETAVATEQVEAVKMREIDSRQQRQARCDDIDAMKSNTEQALHPLEAAKSVDVEGELRRGREIGKGHRTDQVTIDGETHDKRQSESAQRVSLGRIGKELGNPSSQLIRGGQSPALSYYNAQPAQSSFAHILNMMPSQGSEARTLSYRALGHKKKKHYILPSLSIFSKKNEPPAG